MVQQRPTMLEMQYWLFGAASTSLTYSNTNYSDLVALKVIQAPFRQLIADGVDDPRLDIQPEETKGKLFWRSSTSYLDSTADLHRNPNPSRPNLNQQRYTIRSFHP